MTTVRTQSRVRIRQLARRTVNRLGFDVVRDPFPRRLQRLCQAADIDTAVDVGANLGQYAKGLRIAGFDGRILSCEPLAAPYATLARWSEDDPQWTAVQTALGDQIGTLTINVSANVHSSSALPILPQHVSASPDSAYTTTETVAQTTLDELFTVHSLDPVRTLVKIDVQGYEKTVLDGGSAVLPKVAAIQVELSLVPLYEGQPLMPEMIDLMAADGLQLWALEPGFSDGRTGRMLQCDGVFLRTA